MYICIITRLYKKLNQVPTFQSHILKIFRYSKTQALQKVLSNSIALLDNLALRWCHLYQLEIWPPIGATCISYKFSHQVAPLASVGNLVTRWCHLYFFKIKPPCGSTCISSKFSHQVAPLVLVQNLTTRWRHLFKFEI